MIILALRRKDYREPEALLEKFYCGILAGKKCKSAVTVRDAIGDLPGLFPLEEPVRTDGKMYSHTFAPT